MTLTMYLLCFAVSLVGMALHTALKLKSLKEKATLANVEFNVKKYFVNDWLSVAASGLTIILFLLLAHVAANRWPQFVDVFPVVFAFTGYTGSDVASRLFSVVNKKINIAIDYKTTTADEMAGTLSQPTPLPTKEEIKKV